MSAETDIGKQVAGVYFIAEESFYLLSYVQFFFKKTHNGTICGSWNIAYFTNVILYLLEF